jgi:SAM-dependent methyltransferase
MSSDTPTEQPALDRMPELDSERQAWEEIAGEDPFWAVLSFPGQKHGRWDVERFFETGEREVAGVMRRAERLSEPARRKRALDFGCGLGRLTRPLAKRFDTAIGLDISEKMIVRARDLNAGVSGCEFRINPWPDLRDFPDSSFDLVYSGLVLQHLPSRNDIHRYLAEFLRVVRDDGLVVFQLPHELALRARVEPRRRLYLMLRGMGVSSRFLYWRLGLHPNRILSVPTSDVIGFLASRGARTLEVEQRQGSEIRHFRESIYFAARD